MPVLELDDEVAVQADVVKEQVDVEGLPVHFEWHLAADEGEAAAQLQAEDREDGSEARARSPALSRLNSGQKIEVVWVFQDLLRADRSPVAAVCGRSW